MELAHPSLRRKIIATAVKVALLASPIAMAQEDAAEEQNTNQLERISVTANKVPQDLQEVSSSITAMDEGAIARAGIVDITGLENVVPGLRIGSSGGEVRPAMRGARTNEVGVAGTGIAEQIVGIFQDGIYTPTTTAGLGAYADVERIEVLRGPQGTLYGRNTFAGSINVISKQPEFEDFSGSIKVTAGAYDRSAYEAIFNIPLSDDWATRIVLSSDKHDGYIENLTVPGPSDDLREKNNTYLRWTTKYQADDDFSATFRVDYSTKDANSSAIWGYQQIYGYQITETSPGSGVFNPDATVTPGHIYQPGNVINDDLGPYQVYRNAISLDDQETFSATATLEWDTDFATYKWTTNYSELSGQQFYDNDYSDGGFDIVGGFGRQDDQKTMSSELQISSNSEGPLSWIAGLYWFDQEADWEWLWREDTNGDGVPDRINIPGWGNPDHDPHTVESVAAFGQVRYKAQEDLRFLVGLRVNRDEKTFTGGGSIPDWDDDAFLWKLAIEKDLSDDIMLYASAATGYRTGGANDGRVVSRGADALYDNEDVISYEAGMKSYLLDGAMRFNMSVFANTYSDVKAQLFAVACNDPTIEVITTCVTAGSATTFEYYENGGDVDSYGLEADVEWMPADGWTLTGTLSLLNSEFADDYAVGNSELRPLLGLGNFEGRQDINDNNSQFSFAGWTPAMSPEYTLGFTARYEHEISADSYLTPYLQVTLVDDYYAFDTNIPEAEVDAHAMVDFRLVYTVNENLEVEAFVKNLTDEEVLTRAVVHSQIIGGLPANSVQASWNNPRTWGLTAKYTF